MEFQEGKIEKPNSHEHNRYTQIRKHKPTILFMTVTRFGKGQRHDIAFITDEYKFYFFSLRFAQHMHHISYVHHDKIREIFKHFTLNENTDMFF